MLSRALRNSLSASSTIALKLKAVFDNFEVHVASELFERLLDSWDFIELNDSFAV